MLRPHLLVYCLVYSVNVDVALASFAELKSGSQQLLRRDGNFSSAGLANGGTLWDPPADARHHGSDYEPYAEEMRPIHDDEPVAVKHVALCLFGVMIASPLLFAMTQTRVPYVPLYTFLALEQIISVFIAVMIFQAVDDLADSVLTSDYVHVSVERHAGTIVVVHAVCWLA